MAGVEWIDGGSGLWLELTRSMVAVKGKIALTSNGAVLA